VEQSLQPVDYAMVTETAHCVHTVLALRLSGVTVGYSFKNFCILYSVINSCWGFTAKLQCSKGHSNFTTASKLLGVV